eukprot:6129192-Ditylum_brightwellii.AAC.1
MVVEFGVEYKEMPKLDVFLCYLKARRLRDNLDVGFITRIDTLSKEEQEKVVRQKPCFEEEDIKWK